MLLCLMVTEIEGYIGKARDARSLKEVVSTDNIRWKIPQGGKGHCKYPCGRTPEMLRAIVAEAGWSRGKAVGKMSSGTYRKECRLCRYSGGH